MKQTFAKTIAFATIASIATMSPVSAGEVARFPFRYVHHEIVVAVRVDAHAPCNMLLDTDTSPSAIATTELARLGLVRHGAAGYAAGVGSERNRTFAVTVPLLHVGALTVTRLQALTSDLRPIGAALRTSLCGVLGYSFFKNRIVRIDYPRRVVRVLDAAPPEAATAEFTLDADDGVLVRNARVGARPIVATIDTGDAGFGYLTAGGIHRLGASQAARNGPPQHVRGYNGTAAVTSGTLSGLRVGTHVFPTFRVSYNATDRAAYDLNIGNRLLEESVVTFDYRHHRLTVSK